MELERKPLQMSRSRWVAIAAIMSALAIVGNYVLVTIPNVELGSTVLFVTAYLFGYSMGIWCTTIMAVVFGSINPWGALIPQIWITQVLGWLYISIAGSIMGSQSQHIPQESWSRLEIGLVGGIITLFFDLFTNLGYAWAFGVPYWVSLASGAGFMALHVVTNAIVFAAAVPSLVTAVRVQLKSMIWQADFNMTNVESEE
ncbi:MAG: hypothetical protein ACFFAY_06745 [Promethearchaeota archaeon]